MRLKNTGKHLIVGAVVGFIAGVIIQVFGLWQMKWFVATAFTFITIAWEMTQKKRAVLWHWLDAVVDFLAGNLTFYVTYLCLTFS